MFGSRSDSAGKGQRTVNRSGSEASQASRKAKAMASSPYGENEKHTRSVSTSEGSAHATGEKPSQLAARRKDKKESFEELIRSGDTIQYTLTPLNVRDGDGSPGSIDDHARSPKQRSGVPGDGTGLTHSPTVRKSTSPVYSSKTAASPSRIPSIGKESKSSIVPVSTPPPPAKRPRPGAPVAREARVEWSSTKDIADFLRSTGPSGEGSAGLSKPVTSRSLSVPGLQDSERTTGAVPRPVGQTRSRTAVGQQALASPSRSVSTSLASSQSRSRLLARDATVEKKGQTSDLVDFLREGPPGERDVQAALIGKPNPAPRSKEPHINPLKARTTTATTQGSSTPTQNGSTKSLPHSVQSSFTSQTPLLESNGSTAGPGRQYDHMPVKRKQRRVRDPYAIDTDEDDDDEIVAAPAAKPRRQEESLMDFLRNVPPPPDQSALPSAFDGVPKPGSRALQKQRPSGSSSSPRSPRFSVSRAVAKAQGAASSSSSSAGAGTRLPVQQQQQQQQRSGNSVSAAGGGAPTSAGPSRRAASDVAGLNQARSARTDPGRTGDLASFLKTSGPPPTTTATTQPSPLAPAQPAKDEGSFAKMFRRRKATGAV